MAAGYFHNLRNRKSSPNVLFHSRISSIPLETRIFKTPSLPVPETKIKKMSDEKAERLRVFKRFDANGDGMISAAELGDALKQLGCVAVDEVQRMMDEIDTDGDGFISFAEFSGFYNANQGLMKDVAKVF